MSRIEYYDCDNPAALLWDCTLQRAVSGKRGQTFLKELEAALVTLPSKRLIANDLCDSLGDVCAVGALIQKRAFAAGATLEQFIEENKYGDSDPEVLKTRLGAAFTLVWSVVEANDESCYECTPEERYQKMLGWVRERITA